VHANRIPGKWEFGGVLLVPVVDFPNSFNLDGVLGMSFLHNYRFTIEPDTSTLVLRDIPVRK
jgi:hypothetical protein